MKPVGGFFPTIAVHGHVWTQDRKGISLSLGLLTARFHYRAAKQGDFQNWQEKGLHWKTSEIKYRGRGFLLHVWGQPCMWLAILNIQIYTL